MISKNDKSNWKEHTYNLNGDLYINNIKVKNRTEYDLSEKCEHIDKEGKVWKHKKNNSFVGVVVFIVMFSFVLGIISGVEEDRGLTGPDENVSISTEYENQYDYEDENNDFDYSGPNYDKAKETITLPEAESVHNQGGVISISGQQFEMGISYSDFEEMGIPYSSESDDACYNTYVCFDDNNYLIYAMFTLREGGEAGNADDYLLTYVSTMEYYVEEFDEYVEYNFEVLHDIHSGMKDEEFNKILKEHDRDHLYNIYVDTSSDNSSGSFEVDGIAYNFMFDNHELHWMSMTMQ